MSSMLPMNSDEAMRARCEKFMDELLPTLHKSDMTSYNLVLRFAREMARQGQVEGIMMVVDKLRFWSFDYVQEELGDIDWSDRSLLERAAYKLESIARRLEEGA